MAPITATATGVSPQILDDPALNKLLDALNKLDLGTLLQLDNNNNNKQQQSSMPTDKPAVFTELYQLLDPWRVWVFEEQVSDSIGVGV